MKNKVVALTFLLWFKTLFDKNNNGRKYHALEARGGQSMVPDSGGRRVCVTVVKKVVYSSRM